MSNKPIEKLWNKLLNDTAAAGFTQPQKMILKTVFYGAIGSFLGVLMRDLEPGTEATQHDMQFLTDVMQELNDFMVEVKKIEEQYAKK